MAQEVIVIIDPQKDFISTDGAYARRHSGISQILRAKDNINRLLGGTHQLNVWTVISDYQINQFGPGLAMCIPGTEGHHIDIALGSGARIMVKEAHSCFSSRAFAQSLANEKVGRLILCGFLAEYCVRATALDGLQRGYEVVLLEDAIGTGDDVQHRKENLFSELTAAGARLISSHALEVSHRSVTRN